MLSWNLDGDGTTYLFIITSLQNYAFINNPEKKKKKEKTHSI